ncbi:hypothetical protein V6Z11_A13G262000 [Gossypium hirsutum]|uniref:Pentatricopeptide repeat-containing protein At4g01400, mitochondrial-like n=1 Tax=Gossypium hirsutum TaxID=3635 RepID=A0A1U8N4X4_GOSHI|nr:pentatricopeptide repeat-containing protein At4g01400, mitochondrial-like [Gossypium hirsutum]
MCPVFKSTATVAVANSFPYVSLETDILLFLPHPHSQIRWFQALLSCQQPSHSSQIRSKSMSTLFSYLIKIYAEADLSQKALNVFYKMLEFNVKPLHRHLNHILELLVSHHDFIMPVFDLFKIAYKYGVFPNTKSYNILMGAFCLNGDLSIAYKLFKKLFERGVMPDIESYRILMQRVCKKSQVNRAVDLLEDMLNKRFVPDSLSYTTLLNSLCRKKKLREGRAMDAVKVFAQPLQWKKSYQLLRNFRFQDNFKLGYQWYRPCLYHCNFSCCYDKLPACHHFFLGYVNLVNYTISGR